MHAHPLFHYPIIILLCASCLGRLPAMEREQVELILHGAAFQLSDSRPNPEADEPALYLDLRRDGEHWWRAFGMAPRLNRGMHDAVIVDQQRSDEHWHLRLLVNYIGDAWVRGGWGEYEVELQPTDKPGAWQGSFSGTFRGAVVSGPASATSMLAAAPASDFRPLGANEHPRLLFRADDLPALRAKAETPFGQAALAQMEASAVGLGVLYQLRGDAQYAARARAAVEVHMADNDNGNKMIRTRYVAWRLEQVALAYDLCYHAWDEAFRQRVVTYMLSVMRRMSREQGNWTEYIIWRPTDALSGAIHYAGGLAALALWGHPGPGPDEATEDSSIEDIPIVSAHQQPIAEGQPISTLADGHMATNWLYSGPIALGGDAAMALLRQGLASDDLLRPVPGTAIPGQDSGWQLLPEDAFVSNNYTGGQRVICINRAAQQSFHTSNAFFTVIENDAQRTVQVQAGHGGARLLLNGHSLRSGDLITLEAGRYDILAIAPLGQVNAWSLVSMRPHLRFLTAEEIESILNRRRLEQQRQHIIRNQRHADWLASDGMDPAIWQAAQLQFFWNGRFYREAMGSGGMQSGSTHALAMEGPDILATAFHNVFGVSPSPLPGVERWLPRKVMSMVFNNDGGRSGNEFLGLDGFQINNYQDRRDATGNIIASLLPILDRDTQALAMWYWYHHLGLDPNQGDPRTLLEVTHRPHVNRLEESTGVAGSGYQVHPVYAFVNVPLDIKPQPPAAVLPTTWHCPDHGWTLLRSGWDPEAIVVQTTALLRPSIPVDAPKAGSLALFAFGESWTSDNPIADRSLGRRVGETAMMIIDQGINNSGVGRLLGLEQDEQTLRLSIDLRDVYSKLAVRRTRSNRGQTLIDYHDPYDGLGMVRRDSAFEQPLASGLRAMAVDLSGRSGAPLLMVLVDTYEGEGNPTWLWALGQYDRLLGAGATDQLTPSDQPHARNPYQTDRVTLSEQGFILHGKGEAHLQATFIPSDDQLRLATETIGRVFLIPKNVKEERATAITAEGSKQFFVVLTLQQGPAPAVEVLSGSGLKSVLRVGERRISFDGTMVVLE